jgi:hypothetical protein
VGSPRRPGDLVGGSREWARNQLARILAVSLLGIAFLVECVMKQLVLLSALALAFGFSFALLDWSEPRGFERHLTRSKVRSPADWRVRQLSAIAGISSEPYIWIRRATVAALLTILLVSEIRSGG